jgi:hypothetical protein
MTLNKLLREGKTDQRSPKAQTADNRSPKAQTTDKRSPKARNPE